MKTGRLMWIVLGLMLAGCAVSIEFTTPAPSPSPSPTATDTATPTLCYVFCAQGIQFGLLTDDASYRVTKLPTGGVGWSSCGGNCIVVYLQPSTPAGNYAFALEFPDGRRAQAAFDHAP